MPLPLLGLSALRCCAHVAPRLQPCAQSSWRRVLASDAAAAAVAAQPHAGGDDRREELQPEQPAALQQLEQAVHAQEQRQQQAARFSAITQEINGGLHVTLTIAGQQEGKQGA